MSGQAAMEGGKKKQDSPRQVRITISTAVNEHSNLVWAVPTVKQH
jgi:hypothetical protein